MNGTYYGSLSRAYSFLSNPHPNPPAALAILMPSKVRISTFPKEFQLALAVKRNQLKGIILASKGEGAVSAK